MTDCELEYAKAKTRSYGCIERFAAAIPALCEIPKNKSSLWPMITEHENGRLARMMLEHWIKFRLWAAMMAFSPDDHFIKSVDVLISANGALRNMRVDLTLADGAHFAISFEAPAQVFASKTDQEFIPTLLAAIAQASDENNVFKW